MNLQLFQRPAQGTAALLDLSPVVADWSETTRAVGGYLTASFSLSDARAAGAARGRQPTWTPAQITDFYDSYLGCLIRRVTAGLTCWEGLVYEMRLTVNGVEYTRTLGADWWHNRVKLIFTDETTGAPALSWIENVAAQAQFGRMEFVITSGKMTSSAALALQTRHLLEYAWPRSRMSNDSLVVTPASGGPAAGVQLEVLCAGFWATLNWRYQETPLDGSAHDLVTTLANASEFVTAGRVEANALPVLLDITDTAPQRLGDLLESVIAQADAAGNRWQGGVYAGRCLRYEPIPSVPRYVWNNTLQTVGGGLVIPELVEPGALIRIATGLSAQGPRGGAPTIWSDPQLAYIEAIEYSQAGGLTLALADPQEMLLGTAGGVGALRSLYPLWIGHAEGPRVGMLEYADDVGDRKLTFEAVGPDNVPFVSFGAIDNADADSGWANIGYETFPRIHLETVPGYARKLPLVDAALINGAVAVTITVRSVAATTTELASDAVIICDRGTAMTVNLLAATGSGRVRYIKSIGLGVVTVDAADAETIDGQTTQALHQWDDLAIVDYAAGVWAIL